VDIPAWVWYVALVAIILWILERFLSYLNSARAIDTVQAAATTTLQQVGTAIQASIQTGHAERMETLRTVAAMLSLNQLAQISVVTGEELEDLAQLAKDRAPLTVNVGSQQTQGKSS